MQNPIAIKLSLGYVLFGALWILFFEGISVIFLGITAILLFVLIRRIETSWTQEKRELDTYKHLVSASVDSLALVDKNYIYKAVSRSFADRWGKIPEELIGQKVPDIVGREVFEKEVKPRAELCMTGEDVRYQIWVNRPDGRKSYNHIVYYPHFEKIKKGVISGYVVSSRDITEMHKMEEKLRQAYKMEAIGTLAGGIAHDFNNLLGIILGYAELAMQQTEKESETYKSLVTIQEASQRATDLVKQILTFCRQGEQTFYPVQIDLIIKEVVKFVRASLPATIEIQTKIESKSLVLADPTQIHQVMMNLCANAGHAMKDKGGILTITLSNEDLDEHSTKFLPRLEPGRYVKLSVSDTGTGIPPEIIDRIFDPFFTTKQIGEGTGMGLSVVHGIVESCNGSISVYSEPNQGTVFHVYLPVMDVQTQQTMDQPVPIPMGSERVLFVDDEVKLARAGKGILEQLGYKVDISTSGSEAYEKFRQDPDRFDLIITDLTMPHMTGKELAFKIRALRPKIPIIMITGIISQATNETLDPSLIDKIIMKPVTTRDIAMAIRRVLKDNEPEVIT